LRDVVGAIRARGAELCVVGSGLPFQAAAFRDEARLEFPLYVDPGLAAYRAAGLRRGVLTVVDPRAVVATARALVHGHGAGRIQGDEWQQGGALVIAPDGRVLYRFVSRFMGDHVDRDELLRALPPVPAEETRNQGSSASSSAASLPQSPACCDG
jgi:peroxiredoxin